MMRILARSLRWRLVIAMAVILAAVLAAAGVFSSIAVKREFDRFLITQRRADVHAAAGVVRRATPETLRGTLERIHADQGVRSLVVDRRNEIIGRHPPEMHAYDIRFQPDGALILTRRAGGRLESLAFHIEPVRVGDAAVYLLPAAEQPGRAFTATVDRWLVAGIAVAGLTAMLVILTLFRRVFAPVEALTAGARALANGRLDARVDVRGRDEIAELASSFNSMAAALERNERARRNMVGDVAHELRTPLTNIRAQIEAAQDGLMPADGRFLASIEEDAAMLARLVDDLQQLSLAEAGQLRLELEEVDVALLIDRALGGIDRRGLEIAREVEAGLQVRADAGRIVQVVRNLVVNAIAHATSAIHVSARRIGEWVEISVADDGPGVPPEHRERIFDRFYRADSSRSRATGGAGLGLAIAKELAELHGGSIRYDAPAFIVRLPFIKSS